ncbi:ribonuclease H2 subunit A [Homalodisca vitripennis]|uniref:ribonuclease H2 subunit A n=1 Tax=Homalodisca vitripennis TaxID=197043 RepID=UPI001EEAFE00|nr:ribonuclease H2 subunit A [Homalodisca vitripennis]KAG8265501.1 Ribonuclease H2 subunit A [Homalodisca vitripennis]KAG8278936.1 Ribonuclease H2 subunit A [Homalodisca vitripennis]
MSTTAIEIEKLEQIKTNLKCSNHSENLIFKSPIPKICLKEPCKIGVDEAGRGPVLGPMVYGVSYCPVSMEEDLKKLECADSKTLTEKKREEIFETLIKANEFIGWMVEVISPNIICNRMLQRQKYSLNQVSQDSAVGLIQAALDAGVNVTEVYVDTVGMPEKYQEKLSKIFPQLNITVAKKADSLFAIVSAASICAKVSRDIAVQNWVFSEKIDLPEDISWGSGYPGDPETIKFLKNNIDPVFGFPQLVRFSWSTAQKLLDQHAVAVDWSDEEEEDSVVKNNTAITTFFRPSTKTARSKHSFFVDRGLKNMQEF